VILLIDNYDSFVYNIARYVGQLGYQRLVKRNDEISIKEIRELKPSHIIISPGPCTPNEAGISLAVVDYFYQTIPILGVCLGHQTIGQFFQAEIVRAKKPMHGRSSLIQHDGKGIFKYIKSPLKVARYHSLAVEPKTLSSDIEISAYSSEGEIMALRHKKYRVIGLQFHPESILTSSGYDLLANFLSI